MKTNYKTISKNQVVSLSHIKKLALIHLLFGKFLVFFTSIIQNLQIFLSLNVCIEVDCSESKRLNFLDSEQSTFKQKSLIIYKLSKQLLCNKCL